MLRMKSINDNKCDWGCSVAQSSPKFKKIWSTIAQSFCVGDHKKFSFGNMSAMPVLTMAALQPHSARNRQKENMMHVRTAIDLSIGDTLPSEL
jgi:hypothetical protein